MNSCASVCCMNLSSPMNSTIWQQFSNIINAHYLCLL
jgi:hypothetical protein